MASTRSRACTAVALLVLLAAVGLGVMRASHGSEKPALCIGQAPDTYAAALTATPAAKPWPGATVSTTTVTSRSDGVEFHIHGYVAPGFEGVRDAFEANFVAGAEAGAAFAVVRNGTTIVDLWGGVAHGQDRGRVDEGTCQWRSDTLGYMYSATKGLNALVMAVLNDRKRLQYDAPVAQYWPEFGQRGKENITVSQALSHQSGVSTVETKRLSIQEWASAAPSLILEQEPLWTPSPAQFGYHPWTGGLISAEIVPRVDEHGRSSSQFFQEELAKPLGLDIALGTLPRTQHSRVARPSYAPMTTWLHEAQFINNARANFLQPSSMTYRTFSNPKGNPLVMAKDSSLWELPTLVNTNGFATPRSMAALYGVLAVGGTTLHEEPATVLSRGGLAEAVRPASVGYDCVLRSQVAWTRGGFERPCQHFPAVPPVDHAGPVEADWATAPATPPPAETATTLLQCAEPRCGDGFGQHASWRTSWGHPGFGGSIAAADASHGLGLAYVPNLLNPRPSAAGVRYRRLRAALYEALSGGNVVEDPEAELGGLWWWPF